MFSEDTYHASRMSVAYINGLQSTGTAACAKHFIANNVETNRNSVNEIIDTRTLRETYSQSFEAAVKEGRTKTIMSAYNAVNGKFSSYNSEILTEMLKDEWGFEGYVVSDWGAAVEQKQDAIAAGLDMITKGPNSMADVQKAIRDGNLSIQRVDDAIARILGVIVELKEERKKIPMEFDRQKIMKIAYDTVVDGAVLLKNDNATLPLVKEENIVFFGKNSKETFECGSGSTFINTRIHTNVFDETLAMGVNAQFEVMEHGNVVVYTAAGISGEGSDRPDMYLESQDRRNLPVVLKEAKKCGKKTVVILNIAQPVDMREWIADADAILVIWVPGSMGGKAAADILLGNANPAGRLPVTFPIRYEDTPCFPYYPGDGSDMLYGDGVFVGYKNYEVRKLPVQFPFGFGLSFTTFEEHIEEQEYILDFTKEKKLQIPVTVKNTGLYKGSQVVQLYLSECKSKVLRPVKELKAFEKITLEAGEKGVVNLKLQKESFRIFDEKSNRWIHPSGEYRLIFATSSASEDIFAELPLTIIYEDIAKFGAFSSMIDIAKNELAREIISKHVPIVAQMMTKSEEIDENDAMMNTPIRNVLPMLININIPDAVKGAAVAATVYRELEAIGNEKQEGKNS